MPIDSSNVQDLLDDISRSFIRLADELWDKGRVQRAASAISREEYAAIKSECRALIRRAVEIVTSASAIGLAQSAGSIAGLEAVTAELSKAKQRLDQAEQVLRVALAAVVAVTLVVAAVATPNPVSIGAAIAATADVVAAIAA